jgi:hypothetical protein
MMLGKRSKVFDAMFQKVDSVEFKTGRTVIEDCQPEDIRSMLEFIYTGDLKSELAFASEGVLKVADKYDVDGMVDRFENSVFYIFQ